MKQAAWSAAALWAAPVVAREARSLTDLNGMDSRELKISLAQWSLHRQFEDGSLDPNDFASISRYTYGIDAVEYVNQFYVKSAGDERYWHRLKERADGAGVKSLLIMVDDEGDLGVADDNQRSTSVQNHFKWVDAAKILGCHSIRVNAFGEEDREHYREAMIDALGQLSDYACGEKINVIIENHGLYSSNASLVAEIVKKVDRPNCGTIPDFGNWCLSAKWGSTQFECEQAYDRYQGVAEFLPYARAVSAKSYDFNEQGDETTIDYYKMLKIVNEAGYKGHIGIEYEGEKISEHDGILATKALLEKAWKSIA